MISDVFSMLLCLLDHRPEIKMINFWANWVEAVRFTCEVQSLRNPSTVSFRNLSHRSLSQYIKCD